jgi:hypothetical protein
MIATAKGGPMPVTVGAYRDSFAYHARSIVMSPKASPGRPAAAMGSTSEATRLRALVEGSVPGAPVAQSSARAVIRRHLTELSMREQIA